MAEKTEEIFAVHEHIYEREGMRKVGSMLCTSKSRRLLLEAICNLCLTSGDVRRLGYLVETRTGLIGTVLSSDIVGPQNLMFLTEAILDIAEFDRSVVMSNLDRIMKLAEVVLWGFKTFATVGVEVLSEWARVRGAFGRVVGRLEGMGPEGEEIVGRVIKGIIEAEVGTASAFIRVGGVGEGGQLLFNCEIIGSEKVRPSEERRQRA